MPESVSRSRNVFRACIVNAVREGETLMAQLIGVTREALARQESGGTRDIARRNTASDALRLLGQHEKQLIKAYPMTLKCRREWSCRARSSWRYTPPTPP